MIETPETRYDLDDRPDVPHCVNWNHPAYDGSMVQAVHKVNMAVLQVWHASVSPFDRAFRQILDALPHSFQRIGSGDKKVTRRQTQIRAYKG